MASWILVPSLVSLRNEFNQLAPARDKASDGSIGDQAHADRSSDHNPDETGATPYEDADSTNAVHAIDVDIDLRKAGWSMARAVGIIVTRHRTGEDDRLQNVIYNRRIWSRSWGWTAREYTGSNPHDKHAHFSSRYTTAAESNTRSWGLLAAEQEEDEMTPAQLTELVDRVSDAVIEKLATEPVDLPGRVGDRVADLGLEPQSVLGYLAYVYEQVQAQPKITLPDGTQVSGTLTSRLSRIESNTRPPA